jgi:glycerophosphoryl diester phosphodiesterase
MKHTLLLSLALLCGGAFAFDLQGHRGARGLAPENTLGGFARALAVGVNTLELDVALTADHVPVVMHDPALNGDIARDATGQWLGRTGALVRSMKAADLAVYDVGRLRPGSGYAGTFAQQVAMDGERIPTLDTVFERFKGSGAGFNVEIKSFPNRPDDTVDIDTFVRAVLAVVDRHQLRAKVTIQSFDWRVLPRVRALAPDVVTVQLTIERGRNNNVTAPDWTGGLKRDDHTSTPAMVKSAGSAVWSPFFQDLTEASTREAQALGLKVIPWTVNEPADMDRMLGWKVDGLITDYPDRLRTVMGQRGLPLPTPVR